MATGPFDAETRALLALHLVPGLGPRLTKALIERFGSAENVLHAGPAELGSIRHIGEQTAQSLAAALRHVSIEEELALLELHGVDLLRLGTPGYPQSLSTIVDPPYLLYFRGSLLDVDRDAIAIVGSRQCTNYGIRVTERLSTDLARRGFTVVSGLARGIDSAGHRAALAAGGRTLAVLAGGLARIYPPEHNELADAVVASGALLSEAPMGMSALPDMFPARNRLISGLSRGVIVVEAALKSGALITARHAAEQGREVFAVPGPVDSAASGGTLQLLKDGATLVRDADDVLEALGEQRSRSGEKLPQPVAVRPTPADLTPAQQKLWEQMTGEAIHADDLVQRSGLAVQEVGTALIQLEMRGLIRRLPGNRFERK